MTNQEIFNTVVKHLITQKQQSYLAGVGCAYRGRDNTKCAVGALIKDEAYTKELEGKRANAYQVVDALLVSGIDAPAGSRTNSMLMRLQGLHDSTHPYDKDGHWRDTFNHKVKRIAEDCELELDESLFDQ